MAFALSRGEVEQVLVALHSIDEQKREAFRARMRHLQRLKFPPGTNTGKGRRATYGLGELMLLVIAFELIQLGMTPERAAWTVQGSAEIILREVRSQFVALIPGAKETRSRVMGFAPRGLTGLQRPDGSHNDALVLGHVDEVLTLVGSLNAPRAALIQTSYLVLYVFSMLLELFPEREPQLLDEVRGWTDEQQALATQQRGRGRSTKKRPT